MTAAKDGLFKVFYPMFAYMSFLSIYFCLYLLSNALIVNRQVQRYQNYERKTKKPEMHS